MYCLPGDGCLEYDCQCFSFSLAWKAAAPVMKDSIHFEAGDAGNRGGTPDAGGAIGRVPLPGRERGGDLIGTFSGGGPGGRGVKAGGGGGGGFFSLRG